MQLVLWLLLMLPHHYTLKMLLTTLGGTELLISIFQRSSFILKQLMEKKCHRGKKKCHRVKNLGLSPLAITVVSYLTLDFSC